MVISDLTFLEAAEADIEGAGFVDVQSTRAYAARAQSEIVATFDEFLDVDAQDQPRFFTYTSFAAITAFA